jgi:hypothetical protein
MSSITDYLPEELKERVTQRFKYRKRSSFVNLVFLFLFLASIFEYGSVKVELFTLANIPFYVLASLTALTIFLYYYWQRKIRGYPVYDEEWVMFYSGSIINSIGNCLSSRSPLMKKKYREEALKYAKDFLLYIQRNWTIGNSSLIQKSAGTILSDFRENLRDRLIPAIEKGEKDQLVSMIIKAINIKSKSWTLDEVRIINSLVNPNTFPKPQVSKVDAGFSGFVNSHRTLKHPLFIISLLAFGCFVFGFMMFDFVGLSKEYAVVSSITLFGILVASYLKLRGK